MLSITIIIIYNSGRTFLRNLVEHFAGLVEHYVKTCQKRPFLDRKIPTG